ncbi:MAG: MFS transporter [Thermoplasmata archaeon]
MRETPEAEKTAVLFAATLASFLTPFMGSSVNIALPAIGGEFSMDAVALGWVATSYLLSAAVFLVPFGRAADIYGRKRFFRWGVVIFTASSLLSAISSSAALLISFRVVQGLGGAMIFGTSVAIVTSVYPPGERGRALGINVASVYLGLSLGPLLGGILTQSLGWRSVFLASVLPGLLVIPVVVLRVEGEWAEARGEGLDVPGSVFYGLGITALMCGLSALPGPSGAGLVLLGALGVAAFALLEFRSKSPVLDIRLFVRNPVFLLSNLAALINYSATFAVTFLLSLYLQYIGGLDPRSAGLVLMAQPVTMAALSPLAGRLSDRIEPRIIASAGMAVTAGGLLPFTLLSEGTRPEFIATGLIVIGTGLALFSSPNTNAVMGSVERRHYGVASSTLGTMRLVGQMLSMGIAMLIIATCVGKVEILPERHPALLSAVRTGFAVFSALCFGGVFASLAGCSARRGTSSPPAKPFKPAGD